MVAVAAAITPMASDQPHSRRKSHGLRATSSNPLIADQLLSNRPASSFTTTPVFHANPASGTTNITAMTLHTHADNSLRPRIGRHFHPASATIVAAGGIWRAIHASATNVNSAST